MIRCLLLTATGCITLAAAELVVRDLHLGYGTGSRDFDYAMHGRTVSASGKDVFDGAWSAECGGRWSFASPGTPYGLVIGVDALREEMSYAGGGLRTDWLRACIGCGWALTDRLALVAEVGGLAGRSLMRNAGTSTWPASEQDGPARGYDLRMTVPIQLMGGFGIIPFLGFTHTVQTLTDDHLDCTITRNGWILGLQASWRFSRIPSRLE